MSLLATIRKSLYDNVLVHVSESQTYNYFPPSIKGYVEIRYLHVCPIGGLYDEEELQKFMEGLLPFQPTECKVFRRNERNEVEFGALVFDEIVGASHEQCWRTIDIDVPDVKLPGNFTTEFYRTDTGIQVYELKRRTNVFCYPDHDYMFDNDGKHTLALKACRIKQPPKCFNVADIEQAPAWMA